MTVACQGRSLIEVSDQGYTSTLRTIYGFLRENSIPGNVPIRCHSGFINGRGIGEQARRRAVETRNPRLAGQPVGATGSTHRGRQPVQGGRLGRGLVRSDLPMKGLGTAGKQRPPYGYGRASIRFRAVELGPTVAAFKPRTTEKQTWF